VAGVLAALLVVAVIGALGASPSSRTYLDPASASPGGSRAIAQLLRGQGVSVERVTDRARALAAPAGSTLVVAYPQLLSPDDLDTLARMPADVVLLGPPATGSAFGADVVAAGVPVARRDPVCPLPQATAAGAAVTGGAALRLAPQQGETGATCYPAEGGSTLVQTSRADGTTRTILGTGVTLTNDRIADDGDAALALNLLGAHPAVLWWLTTPPLAGQQPLTSLLPAWVWPASGQLVVAVLLLAWWRGRRLGRVVVEPLPVVVRASETTEGRARLYRRARATDQAAKHLREGSASRLAASLGLPRGSSNEALAAAVSERSGRPKGEVGWLLYGPNPDSESTLVALASQLDSLEKEVRRA
jgi:hypothetical protein